MISALQEPLDLLRSGSSVLGLPLILVGLGLLVFGWRLWTLCVVLSFALVGAAIGSVIAGPGESQTLYALVAAGVFGVLSWGLARHAVGVLGGLVGMGLVLHVLSGLGLSGVVPWIGGGLAFAGCFAWTFLYRQYAVIFVTAFLGASLLVSGFTSAATASPALHETVRRLASANALVVPFVLLVSTVMSCFYQASEVRRLRVGS